MPRDEIDRLALDISAMRRLLDALPPHSHDADLVGLTIVTLERQLNDALLAERGALTHQKSRPARFGRANANGRRSP
jgi:hypothetical protein